jgi:hypothetical protein
MVAAGGVVSPREEFSDGRVSPTQEFMDEQFREGEEAAARERAEAKLLAQARRVLEGRPK